MSGDVLMERMTSPEVGRAIEEGFTTVIVPCGAVEQHGPHLPMFMDAEHGTRLGEAVARRMGRTLVAPTVRVGCSEHHMAFPGTVSLRRSTFEAICHDYTTSLVRHGFRTICFLPTHGGNFKPIAEMLPSLKETAAPHAEVLAYTDLIGFLGMWRNAVQTAAGLGDRVGGHADIAESSIMLVMHPDLVRQDLAESGFQPASEEDVYDRIIREGFKTVTPNGILGDAHGMSVAIGERCLADAAGLLAGFFGGV